jgi:hypothetical protein
MYCFDQAAGRLNASVASENRSTFSSDIAPQYPALHAAYAQLFTTRPGAREVSERRYCRAVACARNAQQLPKPRCVARPTSLHSYAAGEGGCGLAMGAPIGCPCERDEQRPSATPTAGAMGHRPSTGGALRDERAVGAGPEARGHASSQFGEPHPLQDLGLRTLARGPRQEPAAGVSAATLG